MPYTYVQQKLIEARNALAVGEDKASSMGQALRYCVMGLKTVDRWGLDGDAQACIRFIDYTVETAGLDKTDPIDTWVAKAGGFEPAQMLRLSEVIGQLYDWFAGHDP